MKGASDAIVALDIAADVLRAMLPATTSSYVVRPWGFACSNDNPANTATINDVIVVPLFNIDFFLHWLLGERLPSFPQLHIP